VGSREHLNGVHEGTVARDRAMVLTVSAHEVGQDLGVTGIGLRPRRVMALSVARRGHGVDPVDLIARGDQCGHDKTTVLFDADDHLVRVIVVDQVLRDQRVQFTETDEAVGDSFSSEHLALSV
jgi:hypothetical protein